MEAALISPLGRTVLGATKITIGRASDNTLVLNDMKASSHHAEIRPEGQYYSLVDLGSMNGTFVNEQQLYAGAPRPLQSGDTIRIGDTRLTFDMSNTSQSGYYTNDSTLQAAPPPPSMPPNYSGNTSYGMGNYGDQMGYYPPTQSVQPPFSSPSYPDAQLPYTIPAQQQPYASETQMPTYVSPSYGQTGPQPDYMQQPQTQQPSYTPPPLYTPPSQPQPKSSPVRRIILAVVALIIILAAIGTFLLISHNNQVAQQNANATATAQTTHNLATATALAQQNATATVVAQATAVATSHYPPFTKVALSDPLSSSSTGWPSSASCQFGSSGYQISIQQTNTFHYCQNSAQFGEIAFQATMTVTQGDCGGLTFRYVDNNNFYFFEVCQNGQYNLGDFVNNNESSLGFHAASAIKQGVNQQNVIAVTVQGDTINMYVNGTDIDTATSNALTSSTFTQGQVGLLGLDVTNPTSVTYNNAEVWTAS